MEKKPKKLVLRLTPLIFLLVCPLLYFDLMWGNNIHFHTSNHSLPRAIPGSSGRADAGDESIGAKSDSLDVILSRLVQGDCIFLCNKQWNDVE